MYCMSLWFSWWMKNLPWPTPTAGPEYRHTLVLGHYRDHSLQHLDLLNMFFWELCSHWLILNHYISDYFGNLLGLLNVVDHFDARLSLQLPQIQVAKRVFACKYASQLMRRYQRITNNQRRKLRIAQLDEVVEAKIREKLLGLWRLTMIDWCQRM